MAGLVRPAPAAPPPLRKPSEPFEVEEVEDGGMGFANLIAELDGVFRRLRRRVSDLEAENSRLLSKEYNSEEQRLSKENCRVLSKEDISDSTECPGPTSEWRSPSKENSRTFSKGDHGTEVLEEQRPSKRSCAFDVVNSVTSAEMEAYRRDVRSQAVCPGTGSNSIMLRGRMAGRPSCGRPGSSAFAQDVATAAARPTFYNESSRRSCTAFYNESSRRSCTIQKERSQNSHGFDISGEGARADVKTAIKDMHDKNKIFEKLDYENKGMLTVQDLALFVDAFGKEVENDEIIGVVRLLNGLEPDEAHDGETLESCGDLGLDFTTFSLMMDPDFELGSQYDHTLVSIREACAALGGQSRSRMRRSIRAIATRPTRGSAWSVTTTGTNDIRQLARRAMRGLTPSLLESVPPIVILLNTFMIGFAAEYPEHQTVWDICEYMFVAFYISEFLLKLGVGGCRNYFRGPDSMWNCFDFTCLLVSVFDIIYTESLVLLGHMNTSDGNSGDLMIIKILRLCRLARLVRTLRFKIFAELKLMVMGVVSGLRVLSWAIFLLGLLVYLVAVVTQSLIGQNEPEFRDISTSMFTLFRCWTDGCTAIDGTPLSENLRVKYGWPWFFFYVLMTMFITIGLFNLIMAVFIDNVVNSQLQRKHVDMVERSDEIERKFKRLFANYIKEGTDSRLPRDTAYLHKLRRISKTHRTGLDSKVDWGVVEKEWEVLRAMDVSVTKAVFSDWLATPELNKLLDEAEIYVVNRAELFDVLDVDMGGLLSMDELTTGLMKLRGAVTKADIVAVRLKVRYFTGILEGLIENQSEIVHLSRALSNVQPPSEPPPEASKVLHCSLGHATSRLTV